jgi:hypothetical protein
MTRYPESADELLREMQSAVLPVDSPKAVQNRRDRTISHLQRLQWREHGERHAARIRRRATIVAGVLAPILAAGFAFAISRAGVHEKSVVPTPTPTPQTTDARPARLPAAAPVASPVRVEDEPDRNPLKIRQEAPSRPRPKTVLASNASFPETEAREHGSSRAAAVNPTSTLSEENGLMERAMVASRTGDDRGALALIDTLLTRFPRSVLREDAQVERLRALGRLGIGGDGAEPALR